MKTEKNVISHTIVENVNNKRFMDTQDDEVTTGVEKGGD